jgi:hypothetical protein
VYFQGLPVFNTFQTLWLGFYLRGFVLRYLVTPLNILSQTPLQPHFVDVSLFKFSE